MLLVIRWCYTVNSLPHPSTTIEPQIWCGVQFWPNNEQAINPSTVREYEMFRSRFVCMGVHEHLCTCTCACICPQVLNYFHLRQFLVLSGILFLHLVSRWWLLRFSLAHPLQFHFYILSLFPSHCHLQHLLLRHFSEFLPLSSLQDSRSSSFSPLSVKQSWISLQV